MKPIIRAAVDSGRPPLELLLDEPDRKRCKWDGKLIKALYMNEAFEVDGYPIWVEESPDIEFRARTRTIRSAEVVEKKQNQKAGKKNQEGKRFFAEAILKPGKKWPTRSDWLAKQRKGAPEIDPEDEKAILRAKEAEERAAARMAEATAADPELARIIADAEARLKAQSARLET